MTAWKPSPEFEEAIARHQAEASKREAREADLLKALEALVDQREERLAFDVETAAAKVGLSPRKLRELIEQGRLRVVRIDRRVLVTPEALRELLAAE